MNSNNRCKICSGMLEIAGSLRSGTRVLRCISCGTCYLASKRK